MEGDVRKFIFFNCRDRESHPETVRLTLELAQWLLEENGFSIKPNEVEYIDLFTNVLYVGRKVRKSTLKELDDHARLIELIWPSLDP